MRVALVVISFVLAGCTAQAPMPRLDTRSYADCKSVDCVVDTIDSLPAEQKQCDRPPWMDGYEMRPLRWLIDNGRLEIVEWNKYAVAIPAFIGVWPYGAAIVRRGKYGDFHSATVYYSEDPGWHVLAHELMHVACPCSDRGLFAALLGWSFWNEHTPEQKAIMESECVSRWTDTSFYKAERETQYATRLFK